MAKKRIKDLTNTATEADLVAGNYLPIDGSAGTKKLPAEDVAKRSIQDNILSSIAKEYDSGTGAVAEGTYLHDGKTYVCKEDVSGAWDASKFIEVKTALVSKDLFLMSEFSLVGISEIGNVGTIRLKDFFVNDGDELSVTIPNPTWNTSNIGGGEGYCFTCGYVLNGNRVNVVAYTTGNLAQHAGETVVLPRGYTNYYVGMRGNTGEVAKFSLVRTSKLTEYIKTESENIVNDGTITFVGNGNTAIVVQIPVYGECSVEYTLPNAWPLTGVSSSAYVCIGGQYNVVTTENSDSYRTFKNRISANAMPNELGSTKTIQLTGTTKSFYLFLRAAVGESVSLTYRITQKSSVAEESNRTNIRDIQMLMQDHPNYSAVQYNLSDNVSKSTTLTLSDFPTDMNKKFAHGMELDPILKNPGNASWGQGFVISAEGFVINFITETSLARPCVGSLFNPSVGYNRTVSTSGYMTGNPHCNFAFWGTEKYNENDKYPLLYVGGHLGTSDFSVAANILVMRIVGDLADVENVSFSIVQVITFPASIGQVTDAQVIGGNLYAIYGSKFTKFSALPQLSQGNVTFTDADILDSFTLSSVWTPNPIQCGCVVDGMYYSVHGSGSTGVIAIIDVANKTGKTGMMPKFGEYEAIFYFMNNFYITNKITNTYGLAQALIVSKLTMTFDE